MCGEIPHSVGPGVLGEVAQRGDGEIVVAVAETDPAGVGEQVLPRWAATAATGPARRGSHLGLAVGDQRVEVAAHGRLGEPQSGRDIGSGDRPLLHEQARHRLPRAGLAFHNTSVAYLVERGNGGAPTG